MTATHYTLDTFPAGRPGGRPFDLPAEYRRMFGEHRVPFVLLPTGKPAHLVGRYADVRAVLAGPVSADGQLPGFPMAREGSRPGSGTLSFFRMDAPDHRKYRKLTTGSFTLARVAALRPMLEQAVAGLIGELLRKEPPVDLVEDFALPVPSLMICQILGVPYADRQHFQGLSNILTRGPQYGREAFRQAAGELRAYIVALAGRKRDAPGDDLLSGLIGRFTEDPGLDPEQLAAIVLLLLVAGHETTASMISLGMLALLTDRDQLKVLTSDDSVNTADAVEELLRYISIAQWIPRVAAQDLELDGYRIRRGDGLIALPMMANRDSEVFASPDQLDLRRPGVPHIAFGFGPHQCLGLQLARMELQVVYRALALAIPGLRLAVPAGQLRFRQQAAIYGIDELPVTW
ncbi:MAG TPA: cytochrome P450 [Streptosporangiaceae bacterium]|jgi:cytochrome P450